MESNYEGERKFVEPSIDKLRENKYITTLRSLNSDRYMYAYILENNELKCPINTGVVSPSSSKKVLKISNYIIIIHNNIYSTHQGPRNNLYVFVLDNQLRIKKQIEILSHEHDYFSNFNVKSVNNEIIIVLQRLNRYLNTEAIDSIEILKINLEEIV